VVLTEGVVIDAPLTVGAAARTMRDLPQGAPQRYQQVTNDAED
jgi:hypothetical protein